jgi:CelD/BcsL family acetyltransferase involved in cellulose biosynthesis
VISAEVLPPTFPLEQLQSDWNRLHGCGTWEPSLSYGWARAIIRNHLARSQDWFTVLLRRSSEIVGIIPMVRSHRDVFGRRVTMLAPLQEKNFTHSDLLIRDHDPALLGAWLEATATRAGRWDLLQMSRLLEDGRLCATLQQCLRASGRPFEMPLWQPAYFLPLPATYDEYLQERSGKFRNYLRRAEKRLLATGDCRLEAVRAQDNCEAAYQDLIEIETASWKHANGTAISAVAHQVGFYRDLIESAQRAGVLHLTFLRIDGRPVAHNLGIVANDCYYYLKTSFRDDHKALGVATVGRAWLIRKLIADGLSRFDFPGVPYEWERQWTGQVRWHRSLAIYNRTANAALLRLVRAVRSLMRRRGAERTVEHHDPRDLKGSEA